MARRRNAAEGEKARSGNALRESEARFRSLIDLSSDWYWEQDTEYRFTRIEGRAVAGGDPRLRARLMGSRRWESEGLQIEGGWEAHIALVAAHKPYHDVLMWRMKEDGSTRYLRVSGEPVYGRGRQFAGYRGVGRDVSAEMRERQLLRLEHKVAQVLSEAQNEHAGVVAVLRAVCETENWACGRYFAVDEMAGVLRFRDAWTIADAAIQRFIDQLRSYVFKPGEGMNGHVWQTGEPVWSTDVAHDPRVVPKEILARAGIRGSFAFAAGTESTRMGVFAFSDRALREPDARLLDSARVIGRQVGQFLQRMRAEEALRESEARFRSLTQMSSDFYWETDESSRLVELVHGPNYAAKFVAVILGKAAWDLPSTLPDEAGWEKLRATVDARQPVRDFEFGRPLSSGGARYFSVSGEPRYAPDGRFLGYRGVGRDITEIVQAREHVASLAYNDALTGLANRTSLAPALEQAVERARRRGSPLAAMFLDLDGFKEINDRHGHAAGDRVLVEVSGRLRAALRASDLVARLGGDEFFVVLEDAQEPARIETVARKLLGEIERPFELPSGERPSLSASIGISVFPSDAADASMLMRHSDRAMYDAKQSGKNAFCFFKDSAG
jgi:diguanylate cyclase (GGDEF)-like protein/PAS domain S-box-containing protein